MKTSLNSAPRRFRAWKRNLCAAVAVATLAPAGLLVSNGIAHADPVVAAGGQCPADSDALTAAANADIPWINYLAALQKRPTDGFTWFDVLNNKGSMYNVARSIGANEFYKKGYYGQGVDVALIDTGVAPVKGLDNGNVVHGPDLSFESQNPDLAHNDTFGHGTNLASIIAGRDNADSSQGYGVNDPTSFTGIAPGARVISLKAGDASGAVDVTQVIAGVDWVVKHAHDAPTAANPKGFNIRVLNLSLGFNAPLYNSSRIDALSNAVDQAWNAGIVVVASAGNEGTAKSRAGTDLAKMGIASPAFNGDVIAVGSYDQTTSTVSTFSQSASEANPRSPDFIAPGAHIQGLRVPGDAADEEVIAACQAAVTTGQWTQPAVGVDGRFQRASGTSQAAAVVSGAVALLLSRPMSDTPFPKQVPSPDWVKAVLRGGAVDTPGIPSTTEGQGTMCLACSINRFPTQTSQQVTPTTGGGLLDDARGREFLVDEDGVALQGQKDIFGNSVDTTNLALREAIDPKTGKYVNISPPWTTLANGTEVWFNGSFPLGSGLTVDPVLGPAWRVADWSASPRTDSNWSAHKWLAHKWLAHKWLAHKWLGDSLTAHKWLDDSYCAHKWLDESFQGSSLTAHRWLAHRWLAHRWLAHRWL